MNNPIIIAEAGVNHNGCLNRALDMIEIAKKAGADYIKFQTFKAASLVTPRASTAGYQRENCRHDTQAEMLRQLELSFNEFKILSERCKEVGIGFLSTPFDDESIAFIASLKPDFMKVPSGEITNLPYLRRIAATEIPVIISTGMSEIAEIEDALKVFYRQGYDNSRITLLHCTTEYPAPLHDVNLLAMKEMGRIFSLPYGYSDHTEGITVSIAATALGASIIEKHFTIDKSLPGPDHKASLAPHELMQLVKSVREANMALGTPQKRVTDSEKENMKVARRSIVAATSINKGEKFTEMNLTAKRPASGLSPMLWDKIIGLEANRDYNPDEIIDPQIISAG